MFLFGKTVLEKYKSILEQSFIQIEKKGNNFSFWAYAGKEKKVLSYDYLGNDEPTARRMMAWFKDQEVKGVPISKALALTEEQVAAMEAEAFGHVKRFRG